MKFVWIISSFALLLFVSCSEDKSFKLPLIEDDLETFTMSTQYALFVASRDSSCIEEITTQQLKSREEITFKLTQQCDSVQIAIPPGGTITSATLYRDSLHKESDIIAETTGFSMMDFDNYFKVSNQLKGRYHLFYASCHWSSEIWINFE